MNDLAPTGRRLSLDLIGADLVAPGDVARLLARHAVTPARRLIGLPDAAPTEDLGVPVPVSFGLDGRPQWPVEAPAREMFEPFLRGYTLMTELVPGAIEAPRDARTVLAAPGPSFIHRALALACLRWEDIVVLARAILGERVARPVNAFVLARYEPRPNFAALAELARLRDLVRSALGEPEDPADLPYVREDIGLAALGRDVALEIDGILRRDVHSRLIWLGDTVPAFDDVHFDHEGEPMLVPLVVDRGTFDALLPETLAGLVTLDLVEMLRVGQRRALCAVCRKLVVLNARRAGRARRGEAVYHPDCHEAYRQRFVREYQRNRRRAAVNSRSAGDGRDSDG